MPLFFRTATQPANHLSLPILGRSCLGLLPLILVLVLTAAPAWAVSVTLEWDAHPHPELRGYKIFCRLASDTSYDYDKPVWAGTDGKCEITGLAPKTDYCFVVRAFDADGNESGDSNEVFYPGSQITVSESPETDTQADSASLPNTPEPSPMPEGGTQTPLHPILANVSEPENTAKTAHLQTHW
ncbi:MAG: fibronectin type III domain-containing protein, partial [Desulfosarcinaceae bacterium]